MASLQRGIDSKLLISQIKNTAPYFFDSNLITYSFIPVHIARAQAMHDDEPKSHHAYFELCLSAHYLTCATFVPTDVDNQIRFKLWSKGLALESALQMASFVLSSRKWPFEQVSDRWVTGVGDLQNEILSGHLGEWFTVACAAYCALKRYREPEAEVKRSELFSEISDEIHRHSEIFGSLWRGKDGIGCLKASANIAHNMGDLDRVMDMWELDAGDSLRLKFYKLAAKPFDTEGKLRYLGRLWVAGELYKSPIQESSMALENHRHFALRKPRCLRQDRAFLIPFGPFLDNWGKKVGTLLQKLSSDAQSEVIGALENGAIRMPKTFGYRRALLGMAEACPAIFQDRMNQKLPSQTTFEQEWGDEALALMEDIPSRA